MGAAYKPEVNGDLDTQNFIKFDEVCKCRSRIFLAFHLLDVVLIFLRLVPLFLYSYIASMSVPVFLMLNKICYKVHSLFNSLTDPQKQLLKSQIYGLKVHLMFGWIFSFQ